MFSVTIDHPDGWLSLLMAGLVIWLHILKPRYIMIASSKVHKSCMQGYFGKILTRDEDLLQSALDSAFINDANIDESFLETYWLTQTRCPSDTLYKPKPLHVFCFAYVASSRFSRSLPMVASRSSFNTQL